jgi:hypothetical protein
MRRGIVGILLELISGKEYLRRKFMTCMMSLLRRKMIPGIADFLCHSLIFMMSDDL